MEEERRGEFVNRRMGRMTGGQVGGAGRAVQSGLPPVRGHSLGLHGGAARGVGRRVWPVFWVGVAVFRTG